MSSKARTIRAWLGAALAAASFLPSLSKAEEYDVRNRAEYTDSAGAQTQKYTFGISPAGKGKYAEMLRIYDTNTEAGNLFNPSVRFTTGSLCSILFSESGLRDGFGVQEGYKLGNTTLFGNYEQEKAGNVLSERKGAGIESKAGAFTLGAGFDSLTGPERDVSRAYVGWDINKNNNVGIEYVNVSSPSGDTHIVDGAWVRYGADQKLGVRSYFKGTHIEGARKDCLEFDLILAQNPALGRASGAAIYGRGVDKFYDIGTLKAPVALVERTPLGERSNKGFAAQLDILANQNGERPSSGSTRLEVGYVMPMSAGSYICPTLFHKDFFGTSAKTQKGASIQFKRGNLILEASKCSGKDWYASIQWTPRLGRRN